MGAIKTGWDFLQEWGRVDFPVNFYIFLFMM